MKPRQGCSRGILPGRRDILITVKDMRPDLCSENCRTDEEIHCRRFGLSHGELLLHNFRATLFGRNTQLRVVDMPLV
jgi:hypothetical protein